MLTRLIGDIHGDFRRYKEIASEATYSVQLGDFGIGFAGPYWHDQVNLFHEYSAGKHSFIRGNHDHPDMCRKEMKGWIPDGFIDLNGVMYIGGAWSIDHAWRTEGTDWWRDEECSYAEFDKFLSVYEQAKPRVMITHDAPQFMANEMVRRGYGMGTISESAHPTVTGQGLEALYNIHQPEYWYFGHWHKTVRLETDTTVFQCLGELEFMDVEL